MEGERGPAADVLGREAELELLRSHVLGDSGLRLITISGQPGVGKSTVWSAAVAMAGQSGTRVLTARPAEAESHLPFTILSDLVGAVEPDHLLTLPAPQRQALEVALLRSESSGAAPHARAVSMAVLGVLNELANRGPVLVAIDDLQWADGLSVEALAFAARRAATSDLRVLVSRRAGPESPLERGLPRDARSMLTLDGLTLGAVRRLLTTRLGLTLSRRVLRQVYDVTEGNPMFALEIGRALREAPAHPALGDVVQIPDSLDELLGARTTASDLARRALLTVALGGPLPSADVADVVGEAATTEAVDIGLLVDEGQRLRAAHPLLAASVIRRSPIRERRALHLGLASRASDPVRRARHLAAAAVEPDAQLAGAVSAGADSAARRGATELAVELAEHAVRLSPGPGPERDGRVLALADYLFRANESIRFRDLMATELAGLASGRARGLGYLQLARVAASQQAYLDNVQSALREGAAVPDIRAQALVALSIDASLAHLERLSEAEAMALEAEAVAESTESRMKARHALRWVRVLRGQPIDDLRTLNGIEPEALAENVLNPETLDGLRSAFRGEIASAREIFVRAAALADVRGDEYSRAIFVFYLAELALRVGDHRESHRFIEELDPPGVSARTPDRSKHPRLRAVAAAVSGDHASAVSWADRTRPMIVGQRWDLFEIQRAIGLAALAEGHSAAAVGPLLGVWRHLESEGVDEVGVFPLAPDLVEAAVATGDLGLARDVTTRLRRLAVAQHHPWGLPSATRCEAIIELAAGGDFERARSGLLDAAQAYELLGLQFDAARTLLALGRHARRARKWAAARQALNQSLAVFEGLGSDGWARQVRGQFDGIGGRKPRASAVLTPSERRTVELASQGFSNKEIAASLFVTEHTVEVHLAHAYPKLGVTSRTQLAAALAATADGSAAT
jgi:DNA-binding CsgD family transcriptional regulator